MSLLNKTKRSTFFLLFELEEYFTVMSLTDSNTFFFLFFLFFLLFELNKFTDMSLTGISLK